MTFSIRLIFVVFFAVSGFDTSNAATIKLGLFHNMHVESVVFSTVDGEYILYGDGKQISVIKKGNMFHIELSGSGIEVHDTAQIFGTYSKIDFKGMSKTNVFQVKSVYPALPSKESEDDLTVDVNVEFLRIVNTIDLEKYIPGTVEAEGGSAALPEYYKAQAIISRTFAVKNSTRHAHEGFNICDGVHCQAFNGKSRMNREIYAAALQTLGLILVDYNGNPAITVYHASCGGITGSSSIEWNNHLYYLVPVNDPFCDKSKHRTWTVTIALLKWKAWLAGKSFTGNPNQLYTGDSGRRKFLVSHSSELPLTEIRKDFGLKSSYFNIALVEGSVVIQGHGYGHGLGLCQHGAMEMAKVGYTYVDILMFYFRGLKITDM